MSDDGQADLAILFLCFGDYHPGGKLCSTWFRDIRQLPNFHDYDIKHGRTYMYFHGDPLYPFGHGLSYTSFSYENLQTSGVQLSPNSAITLTLHVTNTGHVAGDEVVQFYAHAGDSIQRPAKQLAGFRRVSLQPGEKQTVTFLLPRDPIALRYWDEGKQQFACEPGNVELLIGSSSADVGLQSHIALDLPSGAVPAIATNLMEVPEGVPIPVHNNSITMEAKPYFIDTVEVTFKGTGLQYWAQR